MYITIENFNCAIRKNQIRFELLLLNLISIIKNKQRYKIRQQNQFKIVSQNFRHILKRELITIARFTTSLTKFDNFEKFH